jgi:hypothetical protein
MTRPFDILRVSKYAGKSDDYIGKIIYLRIGNKKHHERIKCKVLAAIGPFKLQVQYMGLCVQFNHEYGEYIPYTTTQEDFKYASDYYHEQCEDKSQTKKERLRANNLRRSKRDLILNNVQVGTTSTIFDDNYEHPAVIDSHWLKADDIITCWLNEIYSIDTDEPIIKTLPLKRKPRDWHGQLLDINILNHLQVGNTVRCYTDLNDGNPPGSCYYQIISMTDIIKGVYIDLCGPIYPEYDKYVGVEAVIDKSSIIEIPIQWDENENLCAFKPIKN